jgi:hypothetical protein
VSFNVLRLNGERPLVRSQRADMSAKISERSAVVDVRRRVVRCASDGSLEQRRGLLDAIRLRQDDTKQGEHCGMLGFPLEGRAAQRLGLAALAARVDPPRLLGGGRRGRAGSHG